MQCAIWIRHFRYWEISIKETDKEEKKHKSNLRFIRQSRKKNKSIKEEIDAEKKDNEKKQVKRERNKNKYTKEEIDNEERNTGKEEISKGNKWTKKGNIWVILQKREL